MSAPVPQMALEGYFVRSMRLPADVTRLATAESLNMLAGSTGLEPAASGVTGRRSNQLNYDPVLTDAQSSVLIFRKPLSLPALPDTDSPRTLRANGRYRIRTCDSRRVKPVLYR
jgi:hypothetical protein